MELISGYALTETPHPIPDSGAHIVPEPGVGIALIRVPNNKWSLQATRAKMFETFAMNGLIRESLLVESNEPRALKALISPSADCVLYLYDIIEPLPAEQRSALFDMILKTLFGLHSSGFIFGALTPDTVVSTADGWRLIHPLLDLRSAPAGWRFPERFSPFLPPESRTEAKFDARADLFGAAAVALYASLPSADAIELLSYDRTVHEWNSALVSRGFQKSMSKFLASLLVKDPNRRLPSSFDALARFNALPVNQRSLDNRTETHQPHIRYQRDERIAFNRKAQVWEVDESLGGDGYPARAKDISRGGMLLEVETGGNSIPVGLRLTVSVQPYEISTKPPKPGSGPIIVKPHRFAGVVRWTGAFEDALRVGIEFTGDDHIKTAESLIETIKAERIREELKSK